MLLKSVLAFILGCTIWLLFMMFIDFVMDMMIDNIEIYYPTNVKLFVAVTSFITIFGLIAFAVRELRNKEVQF